MNSFSTSSRCYCEMANEYSTMCPSSMPRPPRQPHRRWRPTSSTSSHNRTHPSRHCSRYDRRKPNRSDAIRADLNAFIEHDPLVIRLVLVSGSTSAGKSTIAEAIAAELGATVASFDWLMSGLRVFPDVWAGVELPVE